MEAIEMVAEPRSVVGKQVRALRRSGFVPVVVYGPGREAANLQVEARHLRRVLMQAGTGRLINVKVNGESFPTLAREIQRNPIRGHFLHVDLYAVDVTRVITATVSIVFEGEPVIVRNGRALVTHAMNEIDIECLPSDLPPGVHVDTTLLKEIGDSLYVRDLPSLSGVVYKTDPDFLVVKISPLAAEELELPTAVVAEAAEVEVVKKAGEEEEEE